MLLVIPFVRTSNNIGLSKTPHLIWLIEANSFLFLAGNYEDAFDYIYGDVKKVLDLREMDYGSWTDL